MKKYLTLTLILLFVAPSLGFWSSGPDKIVIKYLKTLYSNDLEKTYSYISKKDQGILDRTEFIREKSLDDPFLKEMAKTVYSLTEYDIISVEIREDRACVDIKVTRPNMSQVLADIFGPFHGSREMQNPQEAARHMLRQYLSKGDVPMVEERGDFTLVKEDGRWRVLLNLEEEKQTNHLE